MLALAGTQKRVGQGLVLLRHGTDVVLTPVDAATLLQLQRKPAGSCVTVSAQFVTKLPARGW